MLLTKSYDGYPKDMPFGCRSCLRLVVVLFVLASVCPAASAVVVRGVVTTTLGVPVVGARVQLILGPRSVADAVSTLDGSYEIRSDLTGRFILLTSANLAGRPAVQISPAFYAGRTDAVHRDVALLPRTLTPPVSAAVTGRETPDAELSSVVAQRAARRLLTRQSVVEILAEESPSSFVVVYGQTGAPAELYLRGADPRATGLVINGADAARVGGGFDLATLGASGLSAIGSEPALELSAGANAGRQTDAAGGLLVLHSARADADGLRLTYSGDAGQLDTLRQEGVAGYTRRRLDALASFARFDTANSLPAAPFHEASSNANLGYQITANTGLRLTLRDEVSAAALPSPFAFYGVAPLGRLAEQNLAADATYETRTARDWHTLIRYALVRDREQTFDYGTPVNGLRETIAGANGFSETGTASFLPLPPREDRISNRDQYTAESDYSFKPYLQALFRAQYEDERAADLLPGALRLTHASTRDEQRQLSFAGSVQGDIKHRVFYQASGLLDVGDDAVDAPAGSRNTFGLRGAPRIGLSWAPQRSGRRRLSGTVLHATAATGFREPSLAERTAFPTAAFLPRSRTLDAGISQNLLHERLTVRATYFHNQFAHQTELLAPETTASAAGLSDRLAYRTQGLETTVRYAASGRFHVEGGYTYLAALVEQSGGSASANPLLPGLSIGATTALLGQRPFHRPPNTGFATAEYTTKSLSAALSAVFAGRSDDSTGLVLNPTLLLPNRTLDPGYVRLDASFNYQVNRHVTVYTQLDNLTDSRRIAPVGYRSTPFVARSGLRIRFGRGL